MIILGGIKDPTQLQDPPYSTSHWLQSLCLTITVDSHVCFLKFLSFSFCRSTLTSSGLSPSLLLLLSASLILWNLFFTIAVSLGEPTDGLPLSWVYQDNNSSVHGISSTAGSLMIIQPQEKHKHNPLTPDRQITCQLQLQRFLWPRKSKGQEEKETTVQPERGCEGVNLLLNQAQKETQINCLALHYIYIGVL